MHAWRVEGNRNSEGRKVGRFFPLQQLYSNTLMSFTGFHAPGEKRVLHEFINEFFSWLTNVYMTQGWDHQRS